MSTFESMVKVIPEGQHGIARVEHFEVPKHASMMTAINMRRDSFVPEGKYARLYVGNTLFMSDTDMEKRTNYEVVHRAHGHVLIAGLGLGLILVPILRKKEVTAVTVIEKYPDVVALVAPQFNDPRLNIITVDIHEWMPPKGQKFNVIYFDIWSDQSTDDLEEMGKLHRRFAPRMDRADDQRWMNSWRRDILLADKRAEKRNGWWS